MGDAIQAVLKAGTIRREDIFVTTKLWNTNHRPERVKPAHDASLRRLRLDYVDCYLIHTPFAFRPGDEQDPRDARGQVLYDRGVTLIETWQALECLVDDGHCKAIGLSGVTLENVREVVGAARIRPAVVQIESHPSPSHVTSLGCPAACGGAERPGLSALQQERQHGRAADPRGT